MVLFISCTKWSWFIAERIKPKRVTTKMKAFKLYFQEVLFIMLYKVLRPFKSVGKTPVCGLSNESYRAVFSCGTVLPFKKNRMCGIKL